MSIRRLIQIYENLNDEARMHVINHALLLLLADDPVYRRSPLVPVDVGSTLAHRTALLAESHQTINQPMPKRVAKVIQARPRPALVHRK
jgi:hypothetical protein